MQLGQITPMSPSGNMPRRQVTSAEKAAIIVRFLMTEGAELPLTELPQDLQEELTHQMGSLRRIDRDTLISVVEEFANELEMTGLTFPKGVAGALTALDGKISPRAAAQIRKRTGVRANTDPWDVLRTLEPEKLLELIEGESTEVAAVLLSKIDVKTAAAMLGLMPGERARRTTYAVSLTSSVTPDAVDRIGRSLVAQIEDAPEQAFASPPVARVGAILNSSKSGTRDDVLQGLDEEDIDFATKVRKEIFTFRHIALRIDGRDIGTVLRSVDNDTLIIAMAAAQAIDEAHQKSVDFILKNSSSRMADQMREAIAETPPVKDDEAERCISEVVLTIRDLADAGEILLTEENEEEPEVATE